MLKIISKLLGGNKSEKDIATIQPFVKKINEFFNQYQSISNDELRNKTFDFKQRIKNYLKEFDEVITNIQAEAEALSAENIQEKDAIYQEVDKLKKERDKKLEEILKEILPEAYAVVKETANRFTNNTDIISTATDLD